MYNSGRTSADSKPALFRSFTDRFGGWAVSIAFHIALFTILYIQEAPSAILRLAEATPRPIRIELGAPPPPQALSEPAAGDESEASETAPPAQRELRQESGREPATAPEIGQEPPPLTFVPAVATRAPEFTDATDPEPIDAKRSQETETMALVLDEIAKKRLQKQRSELNETNQQNAQRGSEQVEERLRLARVDLKAKQWLDSSDGAQEGVIRTLTTVDVPPEVAERVFARYGIEILYKYLDGDGNAQGFLNRAKTSGGTYYNRVARGHYQVFSFSQAAVARMVQLETQEILDRGLTPGRTRVLEVEYGVVSTARGYDLGVKHMSVAPMEFDP